MRLEDYTPDAICHSLGVGAFDNRWHDGKPSVGLRLLLCPSFAPEVLIDLTEGNGILTASVVAARTQIWHLEKLGPVTTDRSVADLMGLTFGDLKRDFRSALAEQTERGVTLDGMGSHVILWQFGNSVSVCDNPSSDELLGRFIATVIGRVHASIDNVGCRNALARAGSYVGATLDLEPDVEAKPVTAIAVLGTPQEQAEVLAAFAAVSTRLRSGDV